MAGRADIEAGRAYVSLLLKDQGFVKGLDAAGARMKSIGKGIGIFGAAVAGAGAAITGPMLAAVHSVVEAGTAMELMSQRTGLTVESLSELRYAAEQSGADMEAVQKALLMMAKKGFDPQKFDEVAASLAGIEDPGKRAEQAFKIFGKGAGAILPMLKDLPRLRQEARDAGLIMSGQTAEGAHKLHNSWNLLGRMIGGIKGAIGGALIPTMQQAVEWQIRIAKSVRDWVRQNKELFVAAFKIGAILVGVGTAIATFGGFVAVAGAALIGINAVLGVVVSLFSALVSPVGLVVAGLAGLAYWFATSTAAGKAMIQSLSNWFTELWNIATESFGGIADAIAAGDLKLAFEIAMTGLKSAFYAGVMPLAKVWDGFTKGITKTFGGAITWVVNKWRSATKAIADFILQDAAQGGFMGTAALLGTGVDVKTEQGRAELLRRKDITSKQNQLADLEGKQSRGERDTLEDGTLESVEAQSQRIAELRKQLASLNATPVNILGDMQRDAEAQLDGTADAIEKWVANPPSIAAGLDKSLAEAKQKLSDLRSQAHSQRVLSEAVAAAAKNKTAAAAESLDTGKHKSQAFSTFSAAAAIGHGGTSEPPDVKELRESRRILHQQLKAAMEMRGYLKMVAAGLVAKA